MNRTTRIMQTLLIKRQHFPAFPMRILTQLGFVLEGLEESDEVVEGIEAFALDSEAIGTGF